MVLGDGRGGRFFSEVLWKAVEEVLGVDRGHAA
jgi:hypothetical protein